MSNHKNNKKQSQKETNDGDIKKIPVEFANIDNIPVAVCRPNTDNSNNSLAV